MPPSIIEWFEEARADVRAIDCSTAMRLFEGILRFARTGASDVNTLHGDRGEPGSAWGDYRLLSTLDENTMRIFGTRIRSEAYR